MGRKIQVLSAILALGTIRASAQTWPVFYADSSGELPLTKALVGFPINQEMTDLKKLLYDKSFNSENPFCWKFVFDYAWHKGFTKGLILEVDKMLMRDAQSLRHFQAVQFGLGYALQVTNDRLNLNPRIATIIRADATCSRILKLAGLPSGAPRYDKYWLVKVIMQPEEPVPKDYQSREASNPDICYFLDYRLAEESLVFKRSSKGGFAPPDEKTMKDVWSKLIEKYPLQPTPKYAYASLFLKADPKRNRELYTEYLRIEKRSFKSEWIENARRHVAKQ